MADAHSKRRGRKLKDISGERFGLLTAVSFYGRTYDSMWNCICDCGETTLVSVANLRSGNISSCGCREGRITHGLSHTRVYNVWCSMRARCSNSANKDFPDYGGRGITVCERWLIFDNFYADMGDPPDGMSIDRIDVDGHYDPSNCRWATSKQQSRNTRKTIYFEHDGIKWNLADFVEHFGLCYRLVAKRLRLGWSIKDTMRPPLKPGHKLRSASTGAQKPTG